MPSSTGWRPTGRRCRTGGALTSLRAGPSGLPDLLPEHPQPIGTLLDAVDRVVVPATVAWQHPGFYGYFRERRAGLAARRPVVGWPGQSGDALVDLAGGHRGRAGPARRPGRRARARRRLHVRGRRGGTIADSASSASWSRWSRRCTAARAKKDRAPAGGGTKASTAASASTSPPRPTPAWPRPPGRGPGCPRSARRRGGRDVPGRARALLRADVAAVCGLCSCARPSAPPAPARSTRSARSPGRPRARRVGARRRRLGRGRGALPGAPGLLDGVELADRSVPTPTSGCSRRSTPRCCGCATRRRCAALSINPGTCATPRASRAPWSTTATGRSRWAAASGAEAVDGAAHPRARGPARAHPRPRGAGR